MTKIVRVKVGKESDAPIKTMKEEIAIRMQTANPDTYRILDEPKVDVLKLPDIQPQKKSVVPAVEAPVYVEPKVVEMKKVEPEQPIVVHRKPGRPKAA